MDISNAMSRKLDFGSAVYQQLMQRIGVIDRFRGAWMALERAQSIPLRELRRLATIASIGSSTRIEGATLTDAEVASLLGSLQATTLATRDQQEAAGYYDALQVVLDEYGEIPLSARYIHQLHGMLLKHSQKDQRHRGRYKSLANQVTAIYPDGTQRVLFHTTPPHLTEAEMEALIEWAGNRFALADLHPLVAIAAFVYEFLSIHPYQDGNGRLSRLLTTLLMLQQGYGFVQYISFEHLIEERKEAYYRTLIAGQQHRHQEAERIDAWTLFFLDCLTELIRRLEAKYALYVSLPERMNARQQALLDEIARRKTASISELAAALPQHSRNTLKKDLQFLVREGLLLMTGEKRGALYHARPEP